MIAMLSIFGSLMSCSDRIPWLKEEKHEIFDGDYVETDETYIENLYYSSCGSAASIYTGSVHYQYLYHNSGIKVHSNLVSKKTGEETYTETWDLQANFAQEAGISSLSVTTATGREETSEKKMSDGTYVYQESSKGRKTEKVKYSQKNKLTKSSFERKCTEVAQNYTKHTTDKYVATENFISVITAMSEIKREQEELKALLEEQDISPSTKQMAQAKLAKYEQKYRYDNTDEDYFKIKLSFSRIRDEDMQQETDFSWETYDYTYVFTKDCKLLAYQREVKVDKGNVQLGTNTDEWQAVQYKERESVEFTYYAVFCSDNIFLPKDTENYPLREITENSDNISEEDLNSIEGESSENPDENMDSTEEKPEDQEGEIGQPCPDFSALTYKVDDEGRYFPSDEMFVLSQQKGKICIISIWETWCYPCILEMPHLNRIQDEYGDRVQVIALGGAASTEEEVLDWLNAKGWKFYPGQAEAEWTNFSIAFGYSNEACISLGYKGTIPLNIIVDENGVVLYNDVGMLSYEQWKSEVEKALN